MNGSIQGSWKKKGAIVERADVFDPLISKLCKSGVEGRGVERVLVYFLLCYGHVVAAIVVFGFVSAVLTSLVGTLGPKTGLCTMIIARFSSGYLGGIVYSILNVLSQLGFVVTCIILGGQTLASVNTGSLPLVVGVIIVSICNLIPCFIGYDVVHIYERYAWIPLLVVMFLLWGLGGHTGFDIQAQKSAEESGRALTANVLSFGGACSFFLHFFGIYVPTSFAEILGAALMTITKPGYPESFESGSLSGLLGQILTPWKGFGKFLLVVLALSVITNNILNTYSVGPSHFAEILSNFLAILGYWSSFSIVGVLEEYYISGRRTVPLGGYNLDDWDSRAAIGIASILAGCFGALGAIIGLSEVWYTGPIGKMTGDADVGCELATAFSAITYPPFRWLEIRNFGR
ncbi:uncharacterized protein BT62DRAFT_987266 [Guyanagaster necrorhizus]|uniref:Purine-cytosine permease n=1 Tax=Guyanagaster necrorhizus TaxID=856835 RepID=A0A9P8AS16_9AGAR|nr:uncharacterized protein BT62DRAFT_987266 [Guyanagaster necrorhizus MCA 3950]KAG7445491.1 hypothetical protein BT62DRAFT_987266 [Guyanagaster necrorhizus MCA 3950]